MRVEIEGGGYVRLIETMGSDSGICEAARMSYDNADKAYDLMRDEGLINFLVEHEHTSPLEMAEMHFEVYAPLFVFGHFVRHRTANINCMSARYVEMPAGATWDVYASGLRGQSKDNKQVGEGEIEPMKAQAAASVYAGAVREADNAYRSMIGMGVCREQARAVLPQAQMTRFRYKMDLNNLIRFIKLRTAPDAQKETRDYAEAMRAMMVSSFPMVAAAADEFIWGSVKLSHSEWGLLRDLFGMVSEDEHRRLAREGERRGIKQRRMDALMKKLGLL